jgi:hypothetical protein
VSGLSEALIHAFQYLSIVLVGLEESSGASTAKGAPMRFGELEREVSECLSTEHLGSPRGFGLLTGGAKSSFRGES